MTSIFQRTNPAIQELFENAESPRKVMCIPIDYAKSQHTALVCNGEGMQLRGPFHIHNNPAGLAFLDEVIAGLCRKHGIDRSHVFFGGEDCSAIAFNFIDAFLQKGYLGIGLNPRDAAKERENRVASTDKLDLLGIGSLLINKKTGRTLSVAYSEARILRDLTHHRASLVKARSAAALRMHHLVDQLLPGFLDDQQSGLTAFGKASLWMMKNGLAPRRVMARKNQSLSNKLRLLMVRDPVEKVQQLKKLARSVLPPPASLCETLQTSLSHEVTVYEHLNDCIADLEKHIARRLAATPGAMLTTVPGLGMTLSAGLYAEIGDPARDQGLNRLTSYAGLVARLKQTGGPDKEGKVLGRSRRACVPLKRCVMDISLKVGQHGHEELKADYERRVNEGQHVRLTMGRRMLRICHHLIRETDYFLPPSVLHGSDESQRKAYYVNSWDKMLVKWRNAAAIQQAFAPGTPLEQWRTTLNELYGLNLSNTSPQCDRLRSR